MPSNRDRDGEHRDDRTDSFAVDRRGLLRAGAASVVGASALGGLADTSRAASTDPGDPAPSDSVIGGGSVYESKVTSDQADFTVHDAGDLDDALSDASSGDVVWIDGGSTVDIGSWDDRAIPSGVTLASDRGQNGSRGGTVVAPGSSVLKAEGGVRVTGVQFEGPTIEYDVNPKSDNGSIWDEATTGVSVVGPDVEVDNCEFWGFTNAGLRVGDIYDDVEAVDTHVHHNSFHDNAMESLGYGIVVGWATSTTHVDGALIEYNYFNNNRHSIAGNGSADSNYTARYNHQGPDGYSFAFEMHEQSSDGYAGGNIVYHHNTFEFVTTNHGEDSAAIVMRGDPADQCDIYNNWFYDADRPSEDTSGTPSTAIDQWGYASWTNVDWADRNNHFGSSEPAATVGRPRDTLVFNGDARAVNTPEDSHGERSGLYFELVNQSGYDLNVREMTIDPLNPAIDELRDHSYGEGKWTSELYIDADYKDGLTDIHNGIALPGTIDLDADGHSDSADQNAILSAGSKAYVHLYQFTAGGSPVDMVNEDVEFTIDYYLDSGNYGTTTFTVRAN